MGCDIHSVAQIKQNGKWRSVEESIAGDERNYDTFACLANVRNGYGVAGVNTGSGFYPLSDPKGFPEDFEVRNEKHHSDEVCKWMGDHSYSYVTLMELEEYFNKFQGSFTTKQAYLKAAHYEEIKATEAPPTNYCGGVHGIRIVTFEVNEYEKLKSQGSLPDKDIYIHYSWRETYGSRTNIAEIITSLNELADCYGVSKGDVRYVFGFDN